MFLVRQPWLFLWQESLVGDYVSRAVDMGFSLNSNMSVHAVYSICCLSRETIRGKLELVQRFGFCQDECMQMFRRCPVLLRVSKEKFKFGIEFYLLTVKWPKSVLVRTTSSLMYSMEDRVVPRYRVLQMTTSKRLLGNKVKKMSFLCVLAMTEERFLKFISRFGDDAEELLLPHKGQYLLVSSKGS
ncbi:Transcription termination factor like [Quillaja saponaria]|uniref:Transcription termination factor like n=1 Tax=Quillaja saponaria TaxID=32244 RepID=A0AAD7PWV0_QUISA|nr:Transcription termination factor like [Quillaja saponaria]